MAEVKNTFLKSKMNQDLDDRLIPNGEYRYANNISVGKSEADDIGALQNVLGNEQLPLTNYDNPDLECIGAFMDNQNNRIFQFLTDYTDPDPNNITLPESGTMMIAVYNLDSPIAYSVLAEGIFLNFAKNKEFRITGVNLIEGLLFWTDDRNQPRKINVNYALSSPTYYTNETQISVAKYAPVDPISMFRKVTTTVTALNALDPLEFSVEDTSGIVPGMTVISSSVPGSEYITVESVDFTDPNKKVFLYSEPVVPIAIGDQITFIVSTMSDKSDIPSWPGDPDFLEDKYVRFSYRFKFDDNEYSIMAPFTQIAYIPKQKGFFIAGNETDAYRSTVINWFENYINNIELIVPLPERGSNLINKYKIKEIDILYKESDALAVKVFETIPATVIAAEAGADNFYVQSYQSQRPYKTLPEDQTTRVYDKVPVRAKAQESAGNRIIYGNYYTTYTPPSSINYNISVQPKSTEGTNFIEYPNHTVKKNRNYQVGFILSDKYGRQSPVILSTVDLTGLSLGDGQYAKGSTVYSSYDNSVLFDTVKTWPGDALVMYINSPIQSERNIPDGTPGLYATATSELGFAITASTITDNLYQFILDATYPDSDTIPDVGEYLRGAYCDYVEITDSFFDAPYWKIVTSDRVNDIYAYNNPGPGTPDIKFSYTINPIGWYSYKVVVRQQEQDYYNAYLPGMLNGYPSGQTYGSQVTYDSAGLAQLQTGINTTQFPVSETGNTSHIVLINDNINKIPRDLAEVGPDQKQYRSSVQLYGRVENAEAKLTITGDTPLYSAKVTEIKYDSTDIANADWILIKPGDGIQCTEANEPVDDTTPPATAGAKKPNPYRWLGDTVVISNEIDALGVGTIVISSPNWVLTSVEDPNGNDYVTFVVARAENKQYYPTRKADVVTSIANAADFNFMDNSEDNLSGTAGLNFYQLQNKPLIGRISTVNTIGVLADDMIPFLSVYETRPTESALELFWETSTTGLISDLNADVLTGFEGPTGLGGFDYIHFEWQDFEGASTVTGEINSKYITDPFYVKNQLNYPINNSSLTLVSVVDGLGNTRTGEFAVEYTAPSSPDPATYRLYITNSVGFIFNNNAATAESYTFTFNASDIDNPATATTLTVTGRLRNNEPIITLVEENYNITQNATGIVTVTANNGSFNAETTGLRWSILSGDTVPASFSIVEYTGELSLINAQIPLGAYDLVIQVEDAVNTDTGLPLVNSNPDYATKASTITLTINVGDEPAPYWLRPLYFSSILTPGTSASPNTLPPSPPSPGGEDKYGMFYIGPENIPAAGSGGSYQNAYLPTIPGSGGYYQVMENPEEINAFSQGFPTIIPTGLTEGQYRMYVTLVVPVPFIQSGSSFAITRSDVSIYLYRRIYNIASPGVWELVDTDNNTDTPYLPMSTITNDTGNYSLKTTSLTISSDPAVFYEWAIGIKMDNLLKFTDGDIPYVVIEGEDANYSYDQITPEFVTPITDAYEYNVGVETLTGYPTGIPWQTMDASVGIDYTSNTNVIDTGVINPGDISFNIILDVVNNQITPGLLVEIYNSSGGIISGANSTVLAMNVDGNPNKITLQLNSVWGGATTTLAGGHADFTTDSPNETLGKLYSNTEEGTEVRRFYTDSGLTQKWIPPVENRYYVFRTNKNYDPDNTGDYTDYPFFCAQVNSDGEVISQVAPVPNSQTAWDGPLAPIANYNWNIYYKDTPPL